MCLRLEIGSVVWMIVGILMILMFAQLKQAWYIQYQKLTSADMAEELTALALLEM